MKRKSNSATVREDRGPITYLMAPTFREPRRQSLLGLEAVADAACSSTPPPLPSHCPTQNPSAEVQGLGFLGMGISSLVGVKEEELGQTMRKRPQKPH